MSMHLSVDIMNSSLCNGGSTNLPLRDSGEIVEMVVYLTAGVAFHQLLRGLFSRMR